MRVLVLHSDVAPDAPPDERDTLITAGAIAGALRARGHEAALAPFVPDPARLKTQIANADLVFNLVESVFGQDDLASLAPAMLEKLGMAFTGANAAAMALTADKPVTKRMLRAAGLATPGWAEPPHWDGLQSGARYIVKSATADASLGLDDGAVVTGDRVRARARASAAKHDGRWFAETFIDGREFNVAVLDDGDGPRVLPLAEMRFTDWDETKPKIVGYAAKWDDADPGAAKTIRSFAVETDELALAARLRELTLAAWKLFSLAGYARVDFRVDEKGAAMILEINPNPCLEPGAGFAAAAREAGLGYDALIERIALAAFHD